MELAKFVTLFVKTGAGPVMGTKFVATGAGVKLRLAGAGGKVTGGKVVTAVVGGGKVVATGPVAAGLGRTVGISRGIVAP